MKKWNEMMEKAIKKDPTLKKDLEIFERAHQEAKKAGLDKMTMEEIDELIKEVREEMRKEAKVKG
jgi:hypothetical protein